MVALSSLFTIHRTGEDSMTTLPFSDVRTPARPPDGFSLAAAALCSKTSKADNSSAMTSRSQHSTTSPVPRSDPIVKVSLGRSPSRTPPAAQQNHQFRDRHRRGPTINTASALPKITHTVIIDGTRSGLQKYPPAIVLNGSNAGSTAIGLDLQANNSTIKGLVIDNFSGGGVGLDGASGDNRDTITNDYIGVTAAGNVAAPNGGFPVRLNDGAYNNSITSTSSRGIRGGRGRSLNDDTYDNLVAGDKIGTDVSGSSRLPMPAAA